MSNAVTLTKRDQSALRAILDYLHGEKQDFEDQGKTRNHIYRHIERLSKLIGEAKVGEA